MTGWWQQMTWNMNIQFYISHSATNIDESNNVWQVASSTYEVWLGWEVPLKLGTLGAGVRIQKRTRQQMMMYAAYYIRLWCGMFRICVVDWSFPVFQFSMSTISSGLAAVCQCITASAVQNVHDDMVHVRILPPKKQVLVMNCFVLLADRGSLLGLFGRGMGIHVTERFGQLGWKKWRYKRGSQRWHPSDAGK